MDAPLLNRHRQIPQSRLWDIKSMQRVVHVQVAKDPFEMVKGPVHGWDDICPVSIS